MRPLIDEGYIYIAQPPLFRIDAAKKTYWALDEEDRDAIIAKIESKNSKAKIDLQRFKGLGEMMPATLKATTLDPEKRRLLRVIIPDEYRLETENTISDLMGKDPSARFRFIMQHAYEAEDLDV